MRTPRLILASVLAAFLALGAWYVWHDAGASDDRAAHQTSAAAANRTFVPTPETPAPIAERARPSERRPPIPTPPSAAPFLAHRQQVETSGYEAASKGAAEVRALLAQIDSPGDRLLFLRGAFTRFGEVHSPELVEILKGLTSPGERQTALTTLVELWNPAPAALPGPTELDEHFRGVLLSSEGQALLRIADDPLALALARELPNRQEREALIADIALREVARDPAKALSYGEGLAGETLADFQQRIVARWAQLDGNAAWAWTLTQPDAATRTALQGAVIDGLAPADAIQRLAQISSGARAQSMESLAERWGSSDTQAALNWANSLPNPQEKDQALASIRSVAPVGIGATLTSGPEGYPVIREILPGGAASALPQLAEGSIIAAVRDANGNAIDLKGKELTEAIGLIRGSPGTSLTMEIIPPGGSSANRQVVVVTRRQLLFKR